MEKILLNLLLTSFLALLLLLAVSSIIHIAIKVPYIPSSRRAVKKFLQIANLKKNEVVYDLGCGDGRLLFAAEKEAGIKPKGIEAAPFPYLLACLKKWFFKSSIELRLENFFRSDLKSADVIFCYLGPEIMAKLYPKIAKECRKGTRIYSNTFSIKGVKPTQSWPRDRKNHLPSLYLYQI